MLTVLLSVCLWCKEATGFTIMTPDTSYATPYHTQYDTYSEDLLFGDESYYYYDEPVTTDMFPKPNTDQIKFGHKSKTFYNSGGYIKGDSYQNSKPKSTNVISQRKEGQRGTHHKIDRSNSGSFGNVRHTGINFSDSVQTNLGPLFHNTEDLFRNGYKGYTLDPHHQSELMNLIKERLRGRHVITNDHTKGNAKSTTNSPIKIQYREKQPTTAYKGHIRSTPIVPKGTDSTTHSPVDVDVTESPASQTVRQENVQDLEPIVSNRHHTADKVESLSSSQRSGIPTTSNGRSYARSLMLSVLGRIERFIDRSVGSPVQFENHV